MEQRNNNQSGCYFFNKECHQIFEKQRKGNINEGKIDTIYIDKQNISLY